MKIEVTQEDIEKGKRNNKYSCPIALSLGRIEGVAHCFVDHEEIGVMRNGQSQYFHMPEEALLFIDSYDSGLHVTAFSFDLPIEPLTQGTK